MDDDACARGGRDGGEDRVTLCTARRRPRPAPLLLVALAAWLALAGGAAGARAEAPPIAPFTTAHFRLEGTVTTQGQELPIQGEGDVDADRQASRLTIALLGAAFETIVVDGRTYSRNPASGAWQYSEGRTEGGFDPARLAPYDPATIAAAGRDFTRVGTEPIDGVATTHWRADADLARLLGGVPGTGRNGIGAGTATKMDLWIGEGDNRLRRIAIDSQGTTVDGAGTASPFRLALAMTFDNLDAPVSIIAPPGATLAPTPGPTPAAGVSGVSIGRGPAGVSGPAASGASSGGTVDTTLALRALAVLSLLSVAGAGLLAVRHRRARQQAAATEQR
jgi:hypothetical protein